MICFTRHSLSPKDLLPDTVGLFTLRTPFEVLALAEYRASSDHHAGSMGGRTRFHRSGGGFNGRAFCLGLFPPISSTFPLFSGDTRAELFRQKSSLTLRKAGTLLRNPHCFVPEGPVQMGCAGVNDDAYRYPPVMHGPGAFSGRVAIHRALFAHPVFNECQFLRCR